MSKLNDITIYENEKGVLGYFKGHGLSLSNKINSLETEVTDNILLLLKSDDGLLKRIYDTKVGIKESLKN